jgi:hypothetical protein
MVVFLAIAQALRCAASFAWTAKKLFEIARPLPQRDAYPRALLFNHLVGACDPWLCWLWDHVHAEQFSRPSMGIFRDGGILENSGIFVGNSGL